ncbi:MAG: MG2 domain-containing protein, partial [Litorilituus sp.]|nr:MG2 domain-containing protein [Litorilituus sp.]
MRSYALILIISFILCSCTGKDREENSNSKALLVNKISVDTTKSEAIKQIVFTFNQQVALLGAVPSQSQINAVSISHGLNKRCTWRFVTLKQMACELNERLSYLTTYKITISNSFKALEQQLAQQKTVNISTPVPPISIDYEGDYDQFPSSITLLDNRTTDIPVNALDESLLLKLPNGSYKALHVVASTENYRQGALNISLEQGANSLPEGYYEIVLPKGFQPSNSQITLPEETVLSGFWFSSQYKFHGFACESEDYTKRFENVELLENGILPCAPEKISLKFSMPAGDRKSDSSARFNPNKQVDWLVGDDYKVGRISREKRMFYHMFYLNGDTSYTLDLSKIKSMTDKLIDKPQRIAFTTQAATPQWHFDDSFGTVVETDRKGLPVILRRNVEEIHQDVTPINTHQELLSFLKGNSSNSYKNILKPTDSTIKKMSEQPIDFRKHLSSKSGLVHVKLNGVSSAHFGPQKTSLQTKSFMAQSADHNVAIWHQQDLLLQVVNWQAKPIANVEAFLVCEGQTESLVIGSTKEDGVLWVKSKQWQEIYQEHGQQACWIWTQLSNKISAIKLPAVTNSIKNTQNVFAWSAQPIYQPGEQVRIGLIARSRGNNGLVPVTDLSNFEVELLLPEHNESVPLTMSTSTSQGFSNTTYELAQDTPIGYYRIHLTDKRTGAVETVGHFMVAEFTPPEFEQFIKVPAAVKVKQSFKANITARRMNG